MLNAPKLKIYGKNSARFATHIKEIIGTEYVKALSASSFLINLYKLPAGSEENIKKIIKHIPFYGSFVKEIPLTEAEQKRILKQQEKQNDS